MDAAASRFAHASDQQLPIISYGVLEEKLMDRQPGGTSPKIAVTAIIWGFGTGMLAICIPLVALTRNSAILPLAVILGASGSTVVVWRSSEKRQQSGNISELTNSVKQLSERVESLEVICSSEGLDIQKRLKQLEPRDKI